MTAPAASAAAPPSEPVIPRQPEVPGRRLAFRQPAAEELDQILSPDPSPTGEQPPEAGDGFGSGGRWDDESGPESPAGTPSTGSSSDTVEALDSEGLRDAARAAVAIAGQQAHEHLAREGGQKDVGLYLTDEEDQAGIGDPLARIAARHQGVGKVSPDTADFLASMMGVARFATKQITLAKEAKGRDLAGAGTPQPMPQAVDL